MPYYHGIPSVEILRTRVTGLYRPCNATGSYRPEMCNKETCERPFCKAGREYQAKRNVERRETGGDAHKSEFHGVYWHCSPTVPHGEWVARAAVPKSSRKKQLGRFAPTREGELRAALAYNKFVIDNYLIDLLPLNQVEIEDVTAERERKRARRRKVTVEAVAEPEPCGA